MTNTPRWKSRNYISYSYIEANETENDEVYIETWWMNEDLSILYLWDSSWILRCFQSHGTEIIIWKVCELRIIRKYKSTSNSDKDISTSPEV